MSFNKKNISTLVFLAFTFLISFGCYEVKGQYANKNIMGISLGVGVNRLKLVESGNIHIPNSDSIKKFDPAMVIVAGATYEIPIVFLNDRFSVFNELSFSNYKTSYNKKFSNDIGNNRIEHISEDINITLNSITMSNVVKYSFTDDEFKPFIGIGIYNTFIIPSVNKYEINKTIVSDTTLYTSYTTEAIPRITVHGFMMLVSAGINYKNFGFELRFDPGFNYSNKFQFHAYASAIYGIVNIRFFRP